MSATESQSGPGGLIGTFAGLFATIEKFGTPLIDLAIRIMIARVFWLAGQTKIADWENTKLLFEYEYMVPVLPPEIAAYFATFFELGMPILILFGFLTRFAVLPLFVMALVIQFVLGAANPAYSNLEHFYWMILLAYLFIHGAGKISVDHLIAKRLGIR
ncbi:DoxX family protein [Minwuia sp.]|uniref:DoxX family protein n=1 Tax=Minwuia sp. TaxID=2493630 RepID=UPI003A9415B9